MVFNIMAYVALGAGPCHIECHGFVATNSADNHVDKYVLLHDDFAFNPQRTMVIFTEIHMIM